MPWFSAKDATSSCQPGQRCQEECRVAATEPVPFEGVRPEIADLAGCDAQRTAVDGE